MLCGVHKKYCSDLIRFCDKILGYGGLITADRNTIVNNAQCWFSRKRDLYTNSNCTRVGLCLVFVCVFVCFVLNSYFVNLCLCTDALVSESQKWS